MKKQVVIEDAKNYLENAKSILKEKAQLEKDYYSKPKYVKMAGNTAWNGVLVALDILMEQKSINKKDRKNVDDYRDLLAKETLKLLKNFNSAYNILHLSMGYDGELNAQIAKTGLKLAEEIIEWTEKKLKR